MPRLVAVAKRHVARDRDPAVAQHRLEQVLVHAQRRRSDTGADVRHSRELEEALHRAVLAERPVQDRQDDVDLTECGGRCRVGDDGKRLDAGLRKLAERPSASSQRPSLSISTTTVS